MVAASGVSDTSLLAYFAVRESLGDRQLAVLEALRVLGGGTNAEIARYLGLGVNCVTPRVFELRGLQREKRTGLPTVWPPRVVDGGVRACLVTRRSAHVWRLAGSGDGS